MASLDLSQLLEKVRTEVSSRRQMGHYPPGLEQELEAEFAVIIERSSRGKSTTVDEVKHLVLDYLAVVDHLAMMVVELESRIVQLEAGGKSE